MPLNEEEYRLAPKPQLTTIHSIRGQRRSLRMVQAIINVDLLVGRYSAEPYVRVARGWNCDRQNQGRYDYCLLLGHESSINEYQSLVRRGSSESKRDARPWAENTKVIDNVPSGSW